MKLFVLSACAAVALSLFTAAPASAGENPFVGEIDTFAFNFCPAGWLPTEGAVLAIANYTVLFNLIGNTYGGDGTTTFALPKLVALKTTNGKKLTRCMAYLGVYPSQD